MGHRHHHECGKRFKCRKHDLQGHKQDRHTKCRRPIKVKGKLAFCRPIIRFCDQVRAFNSCGTD